MSGKVERRARRDARAGREGPILEVKGDPAFFRRINYRAVAAGFVVAMVVYVGLSAGLYLLGGASQLASYFGVSAVAMYAGGLTAGMIEPKYGVLNGPLVALLFILVTWILTFAHELELVKVVGALGLGPMRVDLVFAADIPPLFFSSLGGYTAGMIEQRSRRPGTRPRRPADTTDADA